MIYFRILPLMRGLSTRDPQPSRCGTLRFGGFLVAALALFGASFAAAAQTALAAPSIGPFRLGMTTGEIVASAPEGAWRDEYVSPHTGRVLAIVSTSPVTIAGIPFKVEARSEYYDQTLRLTAFTRAADAFACEQSGLAWLEAIEPQVGPLTGNSPLAIGKNEANVRFGAGSTAIMLARDDRQRVRPRKAFAKKPPTFLTINAYQDETGHSIEAGVDFDSYLDLNCTTRIRLQRWTPRPEPETLDAGRAKAESLMTIADRHLALAALVTPLAAATDVSFSCEVRRATGRTSNCVLAGAGPTPFPVEAAAKRYANAVAFDLTGFDRDDPQPMRTMVSVRLDPADMKPLDFLGSPRTPISTVKMTRTGTLDQIERLYPANALRAEALSIVKSTCQVQADGSLICVALGSGETPYQREFEKAAVQIIGGFYRVHPNLRSGVPSVGAIVEIPMEFKLD